MKIFWRKLHLWVSLPFGLVIVITCFTGALLVFEDEITDLCISADDVVPNGNPLSLDEIAAKVESGLDGDVEVTGITFSSSPDEAYRVNLSNSRKTAIFVNQYTGEILDRDERLPFFSVVFRLHRWLLDSNPGDDATFWGRIIVGTSSIAFVVILVLGLILWWPRNRKMLKNRLNVAVKKGKNRFWYDLHVVGGFYALLFLLLMALSGPTWSFEWYRNGVYTLFGVEVKEVSGVPKAGVTDMPDVATRYVATIDEDNMVETTCIGNCGSCKLDVCIYENSADGKTDTISGATYWNADAVSSATKLAKTQLVDDAEIADLASVDATSGATSVDATSGATSVDATSGATSVDATSGATSVDATSGATSVDATSGATPVDATSGATAVAASEGVWQKAFEAVLAQVPEYSQMTISDGTISVNKSGLGNQRASDKYIYNKETGEIISVELYEDDDERSKLGGWIYSLHVGSWGGVVTRILAFLAALLGATLPLTGYYFWIRRLYLKNKRK